MAGIGNYKLTDALPTSKPAGRDRDGGGAAAARKTAAEQDREAREKRGIGRGEGRRSGRKTP